MSQPVILNHLGHFQILMVEVNANLLNNIDIAIACVVKQSFGVGVDFDGFDFEFLDLITIFALRLGAMCLSAPECLQFFYFIF